MPRADRYARMTSEQKTAKIQRQRIRRLTKPAINGRLRIVLGEEDYLEIYDELFKKQKGRCAICRKKPGLYRFHMDHDHGTLVIRGLLCYSCNTKLAFVEKYFKRIMRYLQW